MMKKTRLLLICSFPFAVVVALGMLATLPPGLSVTKGNFDLIEAGMTKAEVEEVLGDAKILSHRSDGVVCGGYW